MNGRRSDPVLADFAEPLPQVPDLEKGDAGERMNALGRALHKITRGVVRITLGPEEKARRWNIGLAPGGAKVAEGDAGEPDLELITSEETWSEIIGGRLSPLDAFTGGRIRVLGDVELARLMFRALRRS